LPKRIFLDHHHHHSSSSSSVAHEKISTSKPGSLSEQVIVERLSEVAQVGSFLPEGIFTELLQPMNPLRSVTE